MTEDKVNNGVSSFTRHYQVLHYRSRLTLQSSIRTILSNLDLLDVGDANILDTTSAFHLEASAAEVSLSLETGFGGELHALLGSSSTTNDSIVTVKVLGNFLERGVSDFNVEEVDDDKLDGQPAGYG